MQRELQAGFRRCKINCEHNAGDAEGTAGKMQDVQKSFMQDGGAAMGTAGRVHEIQRELQAVCRGCRRNCRQAQEIKRELRQDAKHAERYKRNCGHCTGDAEGTAARKVR